MAQQTVPIPGEILKTTVIFGLTFDELMVLAALPLVLVLPSAMIDAVPIWISGVTVALGFVVCLPSSTRHRLASPRLNGSRRTWTGK